MQIVKTIETIKTIKQKLLSRRVEDTFERGLERGFVSSSRNHHTIAVIGLGAALIGAFYTFDSCNEQNGGSDDPGISDPACTTSACASAPKHCKGRYFPLQNIHHAWATVYQGPLSQPEVWRLYDAGQRTSWCWYSGGRIYYRHTDVVKDVTSTVGGVSLSAGVWSSALSPDGGNALVRVESHATIGINLPYGLPDLVVNEYYCIGTRIYSGGYHSRNIDKGGCPGSNAAALADANGLDVSFRGLKRHLSQRNQRRIVEACPALSPRSIRRLHPGTHCARVAQAVYRESVVH